MQELLHKRNNKRDAVGTTHSVGCSLKKPQRKQVSYDRNEGYITQYEKKLMQRYRIGYSELHKRLIMKAAQHEFSEFNTPFI